MCSAGCRATHPLVKQRVGYTLAIDVGEWRRLLHVGTRVLCSAQDAEALQAEMLALDSQRAELERDVQLKGAMEEQLAKRGSHQVR